MFNKLRRILTNDEKKSISINLLMTIGVISIDLVGIASVMPFLAVVGNAELISQNVFFSRLYDWAGFATPKSFISFLGISSIFILILGSLLKILTLRNTSKLISNIESDLSLRLLRRYLERPYEYFLTNHSSNLSKTLLSEVTQVVQNVVRPVVDLFAYSLIIVLLVIFLVIINVQVASVVGLVITMAYVIFYLSFRKKTTFIGLDRVKANKERYAIASNIFNGIKVIKLGDKENVFFNRFISPSKRYAEHQSSNNFISTLPKYIFEAVAFSGVILVSLYLFNTKKNLGEILPILGLYAFAGYRLMPASQQVYSAIVKIKFGIPAVESLYRDYFLKTTINNSSANLAPLLIKNDISLSGINYKYPNSKTYSLKDIDLIITANTTVGFIGKTGAGKTTLVDIILGLLEPTNGHFEVDGIRVGRTNCKAWQKTLGYVPQSIFLIEGSVTENIAFGIPKNQIDMNAVINAAKKADISQFIETELSDKYETILGEGGILLSGGQRQRIGIARALYHDPAVLVFDESTSALDQSTEANVIDSINQLHKTRTIIIITHKLVTLQNCDQIFVLDRGAIIKHGTYQEIDIAPMGQNTTIDCNG